MDTQTRGVGGITALRVRACVWPGATIKPVATRRGAIVFQPGKAGDLLTSFPVGRRLLVVMQISQRLAVDFLGDLGQRRAVWSGVSPRGVQDCVWELAAFLLVKFADFQEDGGEDCLIQFGIPGSGNSGPLPLQPAR